MSRRGCDPLLLGVDLWAWGLVFWLSFLVDLLGWGTELLCGGGHLCWPSGLECSGGLV